MVLFLFRHEGDPFHPQTLIEASTLSDAVEIFNQQYPELTITSTEWLKVRLILKDRTK